MKKLKVLHLTPHLGGGVGTVIINWMREEQKIKEIYYTVLTLEKTNNATENYDDLKDIIKEGVDKNIILQYMKDSDIVIIHWFNHPLLFEFLIYSDFPKCRLIIWNHVSALHPPYIHSQKLIEFSDKFIFTSPVSYEAQEIKLLPDKLKNKLSVIWSSCGVDKFKDFKNTLSDTFTIGYTGTVDYSKLYFNYVKMSSHINIDKYKVIVCSNDSQERLKQDAKKYNVESIFDFRGRVDSVVPYLQQFHVFGYPLQPKSLETCSQAIGEAMIAGCVPVVFNNPAERYIIKNNITGIITNTENEYSQAIEYLYNNPDKRIEIAKAASNFAKHKYSVFNKMEQWRYIFNNIMLFKKRNREWITYGMKQGNQVFMESLGNYKYIFNDYIISCESNNLLDLTSAYDRIRQLFKDNIYQWKSESKGSINQYLNYFPDDIYLQKWKEILDTIND